MAVDLSLSDKPLKLLLTEERCLAKLSTITLALQLRQLIPSQKLRQLGEISKGIIPSNSFFNLKIQKKGHLIQTEMSLFRYLWSAYGLDDQYPSFDSSSSLFCIVSQDYN